MGFDIVTTLQRKKPTIKKGSYAEYLYNYCSLAEVVHRLSVLPNKSELSLLKLTETEWRDQLPLDIDATERD